MSEPVIFRVSRTTDPVKLRQAIANTARKQEFFVVRGVGTLCNAIIDEALFDLELLNTPPMLHTKRRVLEDQNGAPRTAYIYHLYPDRPKESVDDASGNL